MKLYFVSAAILLVGSTTNAFVTRTRYGIVTTQSKHGHLRMSTQDDIEALKAKAAKARAEAERLSKVRSWYGVVSD